jgi:hypothetical protein
MLQLTGDARLAEEPECRGTGLSADRRYDTRVLFAGRYEFLEGDLTPDPLIKRDKYAPDTAAPLFAAYGVAFRRGNMILSCGRGRRRKFVGGC